MRAIATEFRDRRHREERKHRLNREIMAPEVRLSGPDNEPLGVVSLMEALRMAGELDVDLVEIAATANPPVCRLMDYGKFKYEAAQKVREARKNQVNTVLKTVRFGLKIDDHDYATKLGQVQRFLKAGDKVKVDLAGGADSASVDGARPRGSSAETIYQSLYVQARGGRLTIAWSGQTGAGPPHLHFELHRHGRPVNPLTMARTAERTRLAGRDLARFKERVAELDFLRDTMTVVEDPVAENR